MKINNPRIGGLGVGIGGLGIGDWGLGPIPNPQSPIPNPQSPSLHIYSFDKVNNFNLNFKKNNNGSK